MDAGSAIAGGGSLIKGVAGYSAGRYNSKVAKFNERISNADGVAEEAALREQARAAMGEQIAAQGAAGFELGTGSSLDALKQSATNAELDALSIRRKARLKGFGIKIDSANAIATGNAALSKGITDAALAVFSGGGDYAAAGG